MPNTNDNQTITLDGVQGALDTASGFVPAPLEMVLSFAVGALSMLGLVLGAQKVMRDRKAKTTRPCKHCKGTGTESEEKKGGGTCGDCNGTGMVEEEEEQSMECKHCEGEGEDPCHVCKGTGKAASGEECAACKGEGKTLTGKMDKDGEEEVADCEICRGEGEISATIKKQVQCDTCGGTGKT